MADRTFYPDDSLSPLGAAAVATSRLRRSFQSLAELLAKAADRGAAGPLIREATEALAKTLDASRVSVWFHDAARQRCVGADSFERPSGNHSVPAELPARQGLSLVGALDEAPLTVPIVTSDGVTGLLRVERTAATHRWTEDEVRYARAVAHVLALGADTAGRARVTAAPRRSSAPPPA